MKTISYYQHRLKEYGITQEKNTFKAVEDGRSIPFQIFTETKNGDISINYLTIDGERQMYEDRSRNTQTEKQFSRIRPEKPIDDKKYLQQSATETYPFPTPSIINAYKKKEKVKTLFIVEGEFKAFSLYLNGVMAIGIGGIHNYKSKGKDKLHPDILRFCNDCEVENVVFIMDADARQIKWSDGDKTDLYRRPNQFYCALEIFNEDLKPYNIDVYLATIKTESEYKGIDDLLLSNSGKNAPEILSELNKFTEGSGRRKYIDTFKISGRSAYKIKEIFAINSADEFYKAHEAELKDKEFTFHNNKYFCDSEDKIKVSWGDDAKNFFFVGTEVYKRKAKAGPHDSTEIELIKWERRTIREVYHSKEIFNYIKRFDGFDFEPENDPTKYNRVIERKKGDVISQNYNLYEPVSHEPREGSHETIDKFLAHIFNYKTDNGEDCLEIALDYLTLLYKKPLQHLPVLVLVSQKRGTGKTTFLYFLKQIFLENMAIMSSGVFLSKFNLQQFGKLLVGVDESELNSDDRRDISDKIKYLTTNETVQIEGKGKDAMEVRNFVKIVFCTNHEKDFVKIDEDENRYWVVKVGEITNDNKIENLFEKMKSEIPAFLYYLNERKLAHGNKSRLWFDESTYRTPALTAIVERTRDRYCKAIIKAVTDQFEFQMKSSLNLTLKILETLIKPEIKDFSISKLNEKLNDLGYYTKSGINPDTGKKWGATNCKYKFSYDDEEHTDKGRYFTFSETDPIFKNHDLSGHDE